MSRHSFVPLAVSVAAVVVGCSSPTDPAAIRLRLTRAIETAPADAPFLYLEGEIVNASGESFTSGGCTRPTIVIDSLGPTGRWGEIASQQVEDLVFCIRAYTVDPGTTASFVTSIFRPRIGIFPKGQRLRARLPVSSARNSPTAEFVLPR